MTVHCPHCATGYLLPDHLVGASGARVRCPHCQRAFVVLPGERGHAIGEMSRDATSGDDSEHAGHSAPPAAGDAAPAAPPAPAATPEAIAAEILDALVRRLGEALADAQRRGQVLSRHGPAILDAYDEYRRRAGTSAARGPFQLALRERCGVSLSVPDREHAIGG